MRCRRLTSLDCEAASNEIKSLLVQLRRRNKQGIASNAKSFIFLRDSGQLDCQLNQDKVVQLAAMAMVPRQVCYPFVDMSLNGSKMPKKILLSSIFACQYYASFEKFVSGELLKKDCLEELKCNLPNGKSFIEDASFSPWGALYLHVLCDVYRGFRDAFDGYYLEQVAEWHRRAGLGLYAATSSPDKLPPVLDSQRVDAAVGLDSAGDLGVRQLLYLLRRWYLLPNLLFIPVVPVALRKR